MNAVPGWQAVPSALLIDALFARAAALQFMYPELKIGERVDHEGGSFRFYAIMQERTGSQASTRQQFSGAGPDSAAALKELFKEMNKAIEKRLDVIAQSVGHDVLTIVANSYSIDGQGDDYAVHASHCCRVCGCKYGPTGECPVEHGKRITCDDCRRPQGE